MTSSSDIQSMSSYNSQFSPLQLVQMFPVYYIFNFLMTLLLILHVIWFTFLAAIVVQVISFFFKSSLTFYNDDKISGGLCRQG